MHTSTGLEFIGSRMRKVREAEGHSQAKCAALLDVSERSYKTYELGKREPPLRVVIDFAEKLNANLLWLITGKESISAPELVDLTERVAAALFEQTDPGAMSPKKFGRITRYVLEQIIVKGTDPYAEVHEVLSVFQDATEE